MPFSPFREVVVIDTESTGFGRTARLVEVAAVHLIDGVTIAEFNTLINPGVPIPTAASRVHGITDRMVRGKPDARAALVMLFNFVGLRAMAAHNASFDGDLIAGECSRSGLARGDRPLYCTLQLARRLIPEAPNHQLPTLARFLALPVEPSHRALADAQAAAGVLLECLERANARALQSIAATRKL